MTQEKRDLIEAMISAGSTQLVIASTVHCSLRDVNAVACEIRGGKLKRWNREELRYQIMVMRASGASQKSIASALRCSLREVNQLLKEVQ